MGQGEIKRLETTESRDEDKKHDSEPPVERVAETPHLYCIYAHDEPRSKLPLSLLSG